MAVTSVGPQQTLKHFILWRVADAALSWFGITFQPMYVHI